MARILIGWQLGHGLGHVVNMVTVGRALAARGHEIVLCVSDPVPIWPILREAALRVVPAPATTPRATDFDLQGFVAHSFADVLAVMGYGDPEILEPAARLWQSVIESEKPDLVLSEFAPVLNLAARGRVPTLAFGVGYCVPCLQGERFPVLEPAAPELLAPERLAASVAEVLGRLGRSALPNPLAALLGDDQIPLGVEELDPYRHARTSAALGPLWPIPDAPVPLPSSPSCLVYLPADHPLLALLLEALSGLGMPAVAHVRGAGQGLVGALRRTRLQFSTQPLDLAGVLPRVSLVIHHAGAGTTERALAWGRPQVLAPMCLEQGITTRTLAQMRIARGIDGPAGARRAARIAVDLAHDAEAAVAAQAFAGELRRRYPRPSLGRVIAECERHLGH